MLANFRKTEDAHWWNGWNGEVSGVEGIDGVIQAQKRVSLIHHCSSDRQRCCVAWWFNLSGLNDFASIKSPNLLLVEVKQRLQGVDYVFMDEVSMLSCKDIYRISERLAKVMNNVEEPFRGMNMIFAGDFAQLPPAIGQEHALLYSRTVGSNPRSLKDQEAAIGKALWHQITTVVVLRENMRQKTQTPDDEKLCEALSNM